MKVDSVSQSVANGDSYKSSKKTEAPKKAQTKDEESSEGSSDEYYKPKPKKEEKLTSPESAKKQSEAGLKSEPKQAVKKVYVDDSDEDSY